MENYYNTGAAGTQTFSEEWSKKIEESLKGDDLWSGHGIIWKIMSKKT